MPCRYEPRFNSEGLGPSLHFPRDPCIVKAWSKFETLEVVDKKKFMEQETFFSSWTEDIRKVQLTCQDDDAGVKAESAGSVANCEAAAHFCTDATHRKTVRKFCRKTCGECYHTGMLCRLRLL